MSEGQKVWSIDAAVMFASHQNFVLWQKDKQPYGGLVWGRPGKKEITQVLFVTAKDMTIATVELLTSSMSADLQLVANLTVDGFEIPSLSLDSPIFQLSASQEILQQADISSFLARNEQLKSTQFTNQGLSLYCRVGIEFNLRAETKGDDLKAAAGRYFDDLDRIVFINQNKSIVLSRKPEKEAVAKLLDEHAKGAVQYKDSMEFTAYHSLTKNTTEDSDRQRPVPIVRITHDGTKYIVYSAVFVLVVPVFCSNDSNLIYARLQEALKRRIQAIVLVNLERLQKRQELVKTVSAVFCPPGWSSMLHLQVPDLPAVEQKSFRVRLQKLLNLSPSNPCLRPSQQILFGAAASRLLKTPHFSIDNYKPLGKVSTVRGPYNYHHYMQDKFDDNGWGCAYRSLQTIWSWLVLNGYTDRPVPSHREIQECLVRIGDKEEKFMGSRQWIGSTEIGFVLDELLGIESKFITIGSGAEVADKARELAHHFDTTGSPIMIGGGQLAHTILGVDFDENTGDCRFLVLDPHYTGSEDIRTVTTRGWCQWKSANFWKIDHFYNMVCPQPPAGSL